MANKENQSEKGMGIGKILLIVVSVFIITPVLIASVIYYTNEDFKMQANKYLVQIPGPVGSHFKSYPTKGELDNQKITVAKYLVEIDNARASDKLTLIRNEDEVLYNEVVKVMLKLNPNKTKTIVNGIRKSLIKKDILTRTVEQIDEEKKKVILDRAKYYESLSLITAIKEIEAALENKEISYSELGNIFENMRKDSAVNLLKYLDDKIRNNIISNFSFDEKKSDIKIELNTIEDNELKLKNLADIYSTETPDKLVGIIGNTQTYRMDDLSLIYKNLGVSKSAQVLARVKEESFVHELVKEIKEKELLLNDRDLLTDDILKAYKIYREYDTNVSELTSIYEKMSDPQIAELIEKMLNDINSPQVYLLDNGETISISDEDLALAILNKFNDRKLASILASLDTSLASEITKKLTMPLN